MWSRFGRTACLGLAFALLSACAANEAYYGPLCEAQGVARDTPEFPACVEREAAEARWDRGFYRQNRGDPAG